MSLEALQKKIDSVNDLLRNTDLLTDEQAADLSKVAAEAIGSGAGMDVAKSNMEDYISSLYDSVQQYERSEQSFDSVKESLSQRWLILCEVVDSFMQQIEELKTNDAFDSLKLVEIQENTQRVWTPRDAMPPRTLDDHKKMLQERQAASKNRTGPHRSRRVGGLNSLTSALVLESYEVSLYPLSENIEVLEKKLLSLKEQFENDAQRVTFLNAPQKGKRESTRMSTSFPAMEESKTVQGEEVAKMKKAMRRLNDWMYQINNSGTADEILAGGLTVGENTIKNVEKTDFYSRYRLLNPKVNATHIYLDGSVEKPKTFDNDLIVLNEIYSKMDKHYPYMTVLKKNEQYEELCDMQKKISDYLEQKVFGILETDAS